jgi:hypothetical protein
MRRRLILLTAAAAGGIGMWSFVAPGATAQQACVTVHLEANGQAVDQTVCVPPDGGGVPELPGAPELPAPPAPPELPAPPGLPGLPV